MKKVIDDNEMHNFFSNWVNAFEDIPQPNTNIFVPRNLNLNYDNMQKNLHMIFGEYENVEEQICLFDDVLQFLQNIVQVDGADRFFSKHFYDIEWNMFLEADFEKSEMKVYRDHFVHQIRNAYFGYYLIWEMGFINNINAAICNYDSTGFAQYINMYKSKLEVTEVENFNKQIILKTWFLAALFHDIGYPVAYHQRYSARIDKFMPYLRVLDNRRQMDFVELSALLADTYLFKMVEYDELKSQYEKFDHGMLSAICFLLNYYHTGAIHRLSNIDRCSIELAAYSIFVHTRKYSIQKDSSGKNKESRHFRPVFVEDPISYLLRFCDDIQEWARVYFIVGENSNTLICDKCKKLVEKQNDNIKYKCSCVGEFEKITSFNYRKINLVKVCNNLDINDDGKSITFILNYDLLKLLEILNIDKSFAKYRNRELENLKELLNNQALLPNINLKYFLSNDHNEIKIEIFRRYIQKYINNKIISRDSLTFDFVNLNKKMIQDHITSKFNSSIDDNITKLISTEIEYLIDYLSNSNNRELFCTEDPPDNYMQNIYFYNLLNEWVQ